MKHAQLSLFLLFALNIFYVNAMELESDDSDSESEPSFSVNVIGSSHNMTALFANLAIYERYQKAIKAAEECDLIALQQNVDESNSNIANFKGLSLLNLSFKKENPNFKLAMDYLLSKGARADKRANEYESCSPLAVSVGNAILFSKFGPLEHFLSKKEINPFLEHQTAQKCSASIVAVSSLTGNLTKEQHDNRARIIALFAARAKNLHEALETFDIPTITKFVNPETVTTPSEDGVTPLLRITSICADKLKDEQKKILELLLDNKAPINQVGTINWACTHNTKTTPLQLITTTSILKGDTSLIPLLLKYGADPRLNLNKDGSEDSSSYAIAQICKTRANPCKCSHNSCPINIQYNDQKTNATKVLELFDAHLAKQVSK